MADAPIENVSDTALWVATFRADESLRPDALFKDPFAERLAGARGRQLVKAIPRSEITSRAVVVRTVVLDAWILSLVREQSVDLVLNLGAGLDTRPYRLDLPAGLRWIEADQPQIISYKESKLAGENPKCRLERVVVNLLESEARRSLFARVNREAKRAIVITEGLLPYFAEQDVVALRDDLSAQPCLRFWMHDFHTAELIRYMNKRWGKAFRNAPLKFAPPDWQQFITAAGWKVRELRWMRDEAARLNRVAPYPWFVKLMMPFISRERKERMGRLAGYALYERVSAAGRE